MTICCENFFLVFVEKHLFGKSVSRPDEKPGPRKRNYTNILLSKNMIPHQTRKINLL